MMNLFKSKKDLFEFRHGTKTWFFTSSAKAVNYGGNTYFPYVVNRSNIEDEDIDKTEVEVSFPFPQQILNDDGDDFQQTFIDKIYFESVTLIILELYKNETLAIFNGRVTQPKFNTDENLMTLICSTAETYQTRSILTRKFQKTCSNKIYDRFCGLNFDDWTINGTVTSISGTEITFSSASTLPDGYFDRGLIMLDGVFTQILKSAGNKLILYRKHKGLKVGDVIKIAPSCDQTRNSCKTKFNNYLRFMGFPDMPQSNPVNSEIIK